MVGRWSPCSPPASCLGFRLLRAAPSCIVSDPPASASCLAGIGVAPQGAPGRLAGRPPNPQRGFAVGRPPRASAGDGFRFAAGGAHSRFGPLPPRRRHRPRASAANPARLALAAGGASAPSAPQGAPCRQSGPARRGQSIATGRAPPVKAPLAALSAYAALTAPALSLARSLPPGRKRAGSKQTLAAAGGRSAPGGRGVAPCRCG